MIVVFPAGERGEFDGLDRGTAQGHVLFGIAVRGDHASGQQCRGNDSGHSGAAAE